METLECETLGELRKAVETPAYGFCSHSISCSPKLPLNVSTSQLDFYRMISQLSHTEIESE